MMPIRIVKVVKEDRTVRTDHIIMDEAIDWHLRQDTMADVDWPAFILWLEEPRHALAFDRVASTDRLLDRIESQPALPVAANDTRRQPIAANDVEPLPSVSSGRARRWSWGVGGLAIAAGLAVLALPFARAPSSQPYWLQTAPGEHREVALSDGTRIELNGATRLGLDRSDLRVARLERGEAVFHVRHDAGRPFSVTSGALRVQDVGTVFDVSRSGSRLDVAVAEGSVLFQPGADAVALVAGEALSAREDTHQLVRSSVPRELVGGWRGGRLAFNEEPLSVVVEALRRRDGVEVLLESGLSDHGFTGMISVSGSPERDIPHLAALIGAKWRRTGDQWILAPEGGAAR